MGIKEVPVEVKHDVTPAERLLYQLQSEGAELEPWEKYNAWNRLWKLKFGLGEKDIIKVGEILLGNGKGDTFRRKVQEFNYAIKLEDEMREKGVIGPRSEGPSKTNLGLMSKIGKKITSHDISYETLVAIGKEDKGMIKKAVREKRPAAGRFL